MKNIFTLFLLIVSLMAHGQTDKSKILEQRARDFQKAIAQNDKSAWRKYMTENFTQALIDRPMRAQVNTRENDNASSTATSSTETQIEAKLTMFERLHGDFGKGKISSVNTEGDKVAMTITTDGGMTGVFRLDAEPKSPWKIDKLGIEVEANN